MIGINNIKCLYNEYRCINGAWQNYCKADYMVDSSFINNMLESSTYFTQLGGYMSVEHKKNRRFGLTVTKVVSVSICATIKKVFVFNYNQAQVI